MNSLTDVDKRYLEEILSMDGGYVLDYSNATFGEFFVRHGIDIHGQKYQTYGTSKVKKMRAFWEREPDMLVGQVLSEMLDSYETDCELGDKEVNAPVLGRARSIVARLSGKPQAVNLEETEQEFLRENFSFPNIQKLPVEKVVVPIIENRLEEIRKTLDAGAHLSVVLLCGSVLEAVLLGKAQQEPARFNSSRAAPKTNEGEVKRFQHWRLAQFIDVASELGILKPDVKKFSHGLRDFRNYIHPYQQISSGFTPDEYTAKVCFQVLKAALASVAGERK